MVYIWSWLGSSDLKRRGSPRISPNPARFYENQAIFDVFVAFMLDWWGILKPCYFQ